MQYDICFRELFAWNNSLLSSYFHSSIITKEKALLVLDQLVLHNGCPQSQTEHLASFSLHTLWLLFPLINLIQLISCCRGWKKDGDQLIRWDRTWSVFILFRPYSMSQEHEMSTSTGREDALLANQPLGDVVSLWSESSELALVELGGWMMNVWCLDLAFNGLWVFLLCIFLST